MIGRIGLRRASHVVVRSAIVPLAVTMVLVAGCVSSAEPRGPQQPTALYVSNASEASQLVPLDAGTMTEDSNSRALIVDGPALAASADGSTIASLVYKRRGRAPAEEVSAVVRDAQTGTERSRFQTPYMVGPTLSRNGSLLVAVSEAPPTEWWVMESGTGAVHGHFVLGGSVWHTFTVDREARRLYLLQSESAIEPLPAQPRPALLRVIDLWTATELARLALPDVLAGPWLSARLIDGARAPADLVPALALSPDEHWLVIVHADAEVASVIVTTHMRVERTIRLVARTNGLIDLLQLVGVAPRIARAKGFDGAIRQALFASDGQHLYIWGMDGQFAEDGHPVYDGRGFQVADTSSGVVLASALPNARIDTVLLSPTGTDVYVMGPAETEHDVDGGRSPYLLRRLDGSDLRVQAQRVFMGTRQLALLGPPSGVP